MDFLIAIVRNGLWSCHVEDRLDVHAGQIHRGSLFAAMPHVFHPFLLPLPMFLQQLRHQYLMLKAGTVRIPPTCNCFHHSDSFSLSTRKIVAYHFDITDVSAMDPLWLLPRPCKIWLELSPLACAAGSAPQLLSSQEQRDPSSLPLNSLSAISVTSFIKDTIIAPLHLAPWAKGSPNQSLPHLFVNDSCHFFIDQSLTFL